MDLTNIQEEILNFIADEIKARSYPPSVREICQAVGLKSTSTVHSHLKTLEKKGFIKRSPNKTRAIEIISYEYNDNLYNEEIINVPIIGVVTAGSPILAVENIEGSFPIPLEYINNDEVFMLRIRGKSMIEAGIHDKDLVLVRQQVTANNGDIIVALLDDSATCKTFYREGERFRLQPENPTMDPIIVDELLILGKVIGLYRNLK